MGLSSSEIFLVLRARDEASRVLRRVSHNLSRMDRDAVNASRKAISENQRQLAGLRNRMGDITHAYSDTTAKAKQLYDMRSDKHAQDMTRLRRRIDDVNRAYQYQAQNVQKLRAAGKIEADSARKQMQQAREARTLGLQQLQAERYALEDTAAASHRMYQKQVEDARRLSIDQKEQLRQAKINHNDIIAQHRERIEAIHAEKQAMRDRGHAMMDSATTMMTVGAGMLAAGYLGARGMKAALDATAEYTQQVNKTLTQVDKVKTSFGQVKKAGLDVGRSVPVAFEQIQPALYDIFSSIDVGMGGARKLLKQFAQDAVGGQADMEVATRANLQIMNAYKVKVKDSAKVSDFMFQLVRKGVGTYEEFAKTIGRAIPSARRAGQSYQTLGAMMAFMTRNGVSAAMAATSSARALDALSHPATVGKLHDMGIEVRKANGEFKPLPRILGDMNKQFGKLTAPQRAKALQELFKGSGGTIQARRFFDMYFKNADEFNKRSREMANSAGAAKAAFDRMKDTPQAKIQAFHNTVEQLKIEFGDHLLPILGDTLKGLTKLLDKFIEMPRPVKEFIVILGVVVTTLTTVSGAIILFAGAAKAFQASALMMGISARTLAFRIGMIGGGLSLITAGLVEARTSSSKTGKSFGIMSSAIGGAMVGFMVGGPIAAGIGGVVGALGGLYAAASKGGDVWADEKKQNLDYADSLDTVTGALTRVTREKIIFNMKNQKMIGPGSFASLYGIPDRDVIDTMMGNVKALGRIKKKVADAVYSGKLAPEFASDFLHTLGLSRADVREAQQNFNHFRSLAASRNKLQKIMKQGGVAAPIRQKIEVQGFGTSMKQLREFKNQGMKPKQLKAIVSATGIKLTRKQLKDLGIDMHNLVKQDFKPKLNPKGVEEGGKKALRSAGRNMRAMRHAIEKDDFKVKEESLVNSVGRMLSRAKARASSGGVDVGASLKAGVMAGVGGLAGALSASVAGAVNNAIAAGQNAAKSHSPSKETYNKIGKPMGQGMVLGIQSQQHALANATDEMVAMVLDSLTTGIPLVSQASDALALAAMGGLDEQYHATGKRGKKNKKGKRGKGSYRSALTNAKAGVKAALQAVKDARKEYQQGMKQQIKEYGSLGSFEPPEDVFGNVAEWTPANIMAQMNTRLQSIKDFGSNLKKMQQMGFSRWLIDQVAQMGPEAGGKMAAALVKSIPSEVTEMNRMSRGINAQASDIAQFAGESLYGAGQATIEGLLKGLNSKNKKVRNAAVKIAKTIVDSIKHELGISSPSSVALGIGGNFGGSMASAIAGHKSSVADAAQALARATFVDTFDPQATYARMQRRGATPVVSSNGGAAAVQQRAPFQPIINTQEIDPKRHAAQLGWEWETRFRG